jgi:adenylylsulfate kinase
MKSTNIVHHEATVTRKRRNELNKHKSVIIWFTGLSGSGKSTIAHSFRRRIAPKRF